MQEKVLKSIVNAEEILRVWNKIGHADKKYKSRLITPLQIPVTWPSSNCYEDQICALDNSKEAQHWRT
eukprot:1063408-Ditylum_brightwellii.AAC.1